MSADSQRMRLQRYASGTITDLLPRLRSRAAAFIVLRLAQYGVLFACALVTARALGPVGRAVYALPLAIGSAAWIIANFSLDPAAARLYARGEAALPDLIRCRATGTLILGSVAGLAALSFGLIAPARIVGHAGPTAIALGAATVPLWLTISAAGSVLLIVGETSQYGLASLISAVVQLIVLLGMLVSDDLTPELALTSVAFGLLVNAGAFVWLVARAQGWASIVPSRDWDLFRQMLRIGLQLHPASAALAFSLQIDLFCIAAFGTRSQVGQYSVAVTLAGNLFLAISALAQAGLHRQLQPDEAQATEYTIGFIRRSTVVACMIAVPGMLLAYPLIRVVYGSAWTPSVLPFVVLTAAGIPLMVQGPTTAFLWRKVRPILFSVAGVSAVTVNFLLNVALIPVIGPVGCALSSLLTYCGYAYLLARVFRRATGYRLMRRAIR